MPRLNTADHERIPQAVWEGSFHLCGVDVKCVVLDDGSRVIENESLIALFDAMANGVDIDADELERFARWQKETDQRRQAVSALTADSQPSTVALGGGNVAGGV